MSPVLVRPATVDDAAAMLAVYAPVVRETAISFEEVPPTVEEFAGRVAATTARFPWLLAEEDGVVLGYCYANTWRARPAYRWNAETAVYVAAAARRRGVGDALYGALFSCLRRQHLCTAVAGITLPNAASETLHRRHGFEPTGRNPAAGFKFGAWHDVGFYRKPLLPVDVPPEEPLRFDELPAADVAAWCAAAAARIRPAGLETGEGTPPALEVRPVRDTDGPAVAALVRACFHEYPGCVLEVETEAPEYLSLATAYAGKGGEFHVALLEDDIVGCVGWCPDPEDATALRLEKLYVSARARRRGLAARLATMAEDAARARGARSVTLWSDTRFTDAHAFYARRGYVRGPATRELHDLSATVEYSFRKSVGR